MRFKGLDLNLLVAFDMLMETRNVSRAAAQLHLTQSAMSSALKRLRQYFGDDLLVLHGKRMLPTAYAEAIAPQVRSCLHDLDILVSTSTSFDPVSSRRRFRLIASDFVITAVLAPCAAKLASTAPDIRLEMILPSESDVELLTRGYADLLVTPGDFTFSQFPSRVLLEEDHVLVGWSENPLFKGEISEAAVLEARHVTVAIGNEQASIFVDREFERMSLTRRIEVIVPSFTLVPAMLVGTERVSIMHHRLAKAMSEPFSLAVAPLPFALPPMREMVQFSGARHSDDGLMWLIHQLRTEAANQWN